MIAVTELTTCPGKIIARPRRGTDKVIFLMLPLWISALSAREIAAALQQMDIALGETPTPDGAGQGEGPAPEPVLDGMLRAAARDTQEAIAAAFEARGMSWAASVIRTMSVAVMDEPIRVIPLPAEPAP